MGASYNKVALMGNVVRDPETRYTQSGKAVTKFALAINNPKSKEATFIDIIAWNRLGERCSTYLKKGFGTFVEGRLVIRSYEDKSGTTRKAVEVVINDFQMLSEGRYAKPAAPSTNGRSKNGSSYHAEEPADSEEDLLPFE